MKTSFFFLLFCALFAVGCKKKNPGPGPALPKANHALIHSGTVDSANFSMDTTAVTPQLVKMSQWDATPYKVFSIATWLKGPHLGIPIQAGEERLTLEFSFVLQYSIYEYDSGCGCLPTPDATRLADHINNGAFSWNDGSERKEVIVLVENSQFGGGTFAISNAQISAVAIGNSLRIFGSIDSLKVGPNWSDPGRFLTGFNFDYTVPVSI